MRVDLFAEELEDELVGTGVGGPVDSSQIVPRLVFAVVLELEARPGPVTERRPSETRRQVTGRSKDVPGAELFAAGQHLSVVWHRASQVGSDSGGVSSVSASESRSASDGPSALERGGVSSVSAVASAGAVTVLVDGAVLRSRRPEVSILRDHPRDAQ